jgi:ribonuclease HI
VRNCLVTRSLGDVLRRILHSQRSRHWYHAHPPKGDILKYVIQLEFLATNNIAEYEELVTDLWLAKDLGIWWLHIRGDSQLVAKQVHKEYDYNNEKIVEYLSEVHRMEKFFDGFQVRYIPRLDNRDADHLA